jgi:hypothetical protein
MVSTYISLFILAVSAFIPATCFGAICEKTLGVNPTGPTVSLEIRVESETNGSESPFKQMSSALLKYISGEQIKADVGVFESQIYPLVGATAGMQDVRLNLKIIIGENIDRVGILKVKGDTTLNTTYQSHYSFYVNNSDLIIIVPAKDMSVDKFRRTLSLLMVRNAHAILATRSFGLPLYGSLFSVRQRFGFRGPVPTAAQELMDSIEDIKAEITDTEKTAVADASRILLKVVNEIIADLSIGKFSEAQTRAILTEAYGNDILRLVDPVLALVNKNHANPYASLMAVSRTFMDAGKIVGSKVIQRTKISKERMAELDERLNAARHGKNKPGRN